MVKPDFIQFIELQEGVFSVMKFHRFDIDVVKYFDDKQLQRVYELGFVPITGKAKWEEVIFKSKQEFYLHFKLTEENDYKLDIYYKPEKRNELLFFTSRLLKPYIDGTTNNTTTEAEN